MKSLLQRDIIIITAVALLLTLGSLLFSWDKWLAVELYNPANQFAIWVRNYFQMPANFITLLIIILLLFPKITPKIIGGFCRNFSGQLFRQTAIIWLLTMIFIGGLLTHLIAKEGVERPRPRQTELLGGEAKFTPPFIPAKLAGSEVTGKSFFSGHVIMGAIFAIPFFTMRQRKPKLAKAFLAGGIVFGATIGLGRMIAGAHFFTDVLWSIAFTFLGAAIFAHYIKPKTVIKPKYLAGFLLVIAIGSLLFNKFEITLDYHSTNSAQKIFTINMPCDKATLKYGKNFSMNTYISGYGSSKRRLKIEENNGEITLNRWRGLYHSLSCSMEISIPHNGRVTLPNSTKITISEAIKFTPQGKNMIFYGKDE